MPMLPITALYAGLAGLLLVVLAARVIQLRARYKIGIGDGGHEDLARRIRVHANCAEYVPIGLILLAVNEAGGTSNTLIHAHGTVLIAARIAHSYAVSKTDGPSVARLLGMIGTFWVIVAGSVGALRIAFGSGW